ncbi:hypothetical protein V1477_006792 [Vespula maculifrons]|uniref:Uncharacterized protein n=1 Tax=Vespula maculifrons TaxID=7453 RepID=A0ABD2CHF9_VESMC
MQIRYKKTKHYKKKQYHSGKGAAFQSGKTSIRSVLPPKGKEELSINLVGSVRQGRRYTDLVSSSVIRRRNTRASFAGELNKTPKVLKIADRMYNKETRKARTNNE